MNNCICELQQNRVTKPSLEVGNLAVLSWCRRIWTHSVCLPGFLNVVGGDDNGGRGTLNQVQQMFPDPAAKEQLNPDHTL